MNLEQERIEQQLEIQISRGTRLIDLKNSAGWADLRAILKEIEDEATRDCILCEPDKQQAVLALQAQARAARVITVLLLSRIEDAIENARILKQEQSQETNNNNF